MSTVEQTSGTSFDSGEDIGAMATIRRGLHFSPELKDGIGRTLVLAVVASVGQVVVPIAVQQTVDRGINGSGGPDVSFVVLMAIAAAVAIGLSGWASYAMTSRLFTSSERGLATLRIKAFRHVHDLPLLTQNTERRGALVSRVTSDVDQVSQFLVFGGLLLIVSTGQVLIATVVMVVYSWQLALVVWVCFAPLFLSIRYFQRKLSEAYGVVRRQVGVMLSAISEPVVGAAVVKSYAVEDRTQARIDEAIDEYQAASTRAQQFTVVSFSLGGISAGLANASVLIIGIWLGFAGEMTAGKVLAFAFLVSLFVGPVQMGTQILTDAQNAIVSWRRVIGILETPADLVDPGADGQTLPRGPIDIRLAGVTFAYPGGPPVLRDIDLDISSGTRVAVVGETGSGKSTIAKLLTRLMDPTSGAVLLDGVDVRSIAQTSMRRSVVLVPQEGFLFDDTLAANVRYGRLEATDGGDPGERRRARSRRLAGRSPGRHRDAGRSARGVLVGGGATARRPAAGPARRSRPVGARRGHQCRRPGARDADRPGARAADDRAHLGDHRAPALHRRAGRRGGRGRQGPDRPARPARRPGHPGRVRLRRAARVLGRPARLTTRTGYWSGDRPSTPRSPTGSSAQTTGWCPPSCSSTTPVRC